MVHHIFCVLFWFLTQYVEQRTHENTKITHFLSWYQRYEDYGLQTLNFSQCLYAT